MKFYSSPLLSIGLTAAAVLLSHRAVSAEPGITYQPAPSFSSAATGDPTNSSWQQWQQEYGPTHEQRMQWWRQARFGMFIHWGVYSVPAGVWNGTNVTRSGAEWIMNRGRIPVAD